MDAPTAALVPSPADDLVLDPVNLLHRQHDLGVQLVGQGSVEAGALETVPRQQSPDLGGGEAGRRSASGGSLDETVERLGPLAGPQTSAQSQLLSGL